MLVLLLLPVRPWLLLWLLKPKAHSLRALLLPHALKSSPGVLQALPLCFLRPVTTANPALVEYLVSFFGDPHCCMSR